MGKKYFVARVVEFHVDYELDFYYLFEEEPTYEQVVSKLSSEYYVDVFSLSVTIEELEITKL